MFPWRAWYAISRTEWCVYSSEDTSWQKLPAEGIVGVVEYLSETKTPFRRILDGGDWYYLQDGRIEYVMTHDEWGKFVDPPHVSCLACLKKSGVMEDEAFHRVQREMMDSKEAP